MRRFGRVRFIAEVLVLIHTHNLCRGEAVGSAVALEAFVWGG